jgi:hypothetical protein
VKAPGFDRLEWEEVEAALNDVTLTKYCDLNLVNLRDRTVGKDTVEVRILPGSTSAEEILGGIETVVGLLDREPGC